MARRNHVLYFVCAAEMERIHMLHREFRGTGAISAAASGELERLGPLIAGYSGTWRGGLTRALPFAFNNYLQGVGLTPRTLAGGELRAICAVVRARPFTSLCSVHRRGSAANAHAETRLAFSYWLAVDRIEAIFGLRLAAVEATLMANTALANNCRVGTAAIFPFGPRTGFRHRPTPRSRITSCRTISCAGCWLGRSGCRTACRYCRRYCRSGD